MDRSKLLKEFHFKEEFKETLLGKYDKTGFPEPVKSYNLVWEVYDLSLEEPYFWILDTLKGAMPIVEKLEDAFAAAENSAFFGVTQQRLGAQQDRVSQFLATTGKMIKELFQMVRELRIIDERLQYYDGVDGEESKPINQRKKSDEITLKGMFVDLVQGGGKSAASVYGMARELEFITLPDLFFDAPIFKNDDELENHIKGLEKDFNKNVLRVLTRHLAQYLKWRKQTSQEHHNRKRFMLSYLKQHFDIIKMYVQWVKPYLHHVSRLTMKESGSSPDIISAFEGSLLDIELLARTRKPIGDNNGANGCILVTFNYRTRPELKVVQEGYQRGPVHIGKLEFNIRVYGWTDKQVENYKKLKDKEVFELMGDVSSSVKEAMDSLGDELDRYLEEAQEQAGVKKKEEKEDVVSEKSITEKLLGDFYTPKKNKAKKGKSSKQEEIEEEEVEMQAKELAGGAKGVAWALYNNFKKGHKMITW